MKKILLIGFLLVSVLCYGQEKYKDCNVYQYRGDDSTNIKLVLTKTYNTQQKIIFAKYDNYDRYSYSEDYDEYDFDGTGENYYTYKDTFLIQKLITHPAVKWGLKDMEQLNTYVDGDSVITNFDYAFDNQNRIKTMRKTRTEKVVYRGECGMAAAMWRDTTHNNDTMLMNLKQSLVDKKNESERKKSWDEPTITISTCEYNRCGLAKETWSRNDGKQYRRTKYDYDYKTCTLISTTEYSPSDATDDLNSDGTCLYKYYEDHLTKYYIRLNTFTRELPLDNVFTINPTYKSYFYDNKKRLIHLEQRYPEYPQENNDTYFFYDENDRRTKVVYTDNTNRLTHIYIYK